MYKIAIIGERESVMGFMAIGFSAFEAADVPTAARILHTLAKNETYAIIFVVEHYASRMAEDIARYKDAPLPAVIPIPGAAGSDGSGMAALKSAVERAVGADILFKE